jgi:glycine/D-amino acid oxidase-like deaminating enzyme
MIIGLADDIGQPFTMDDPEHDEDYFEKGIRPVLDHYFNALKDYELKMKWAGYYAYHWPDKNPVVENVSNIFWVSGTSGSGIMKADGIGRIVASKVLGDEEASMFDGSKIGVGDLSLKHRNVELEKFVI